MKNLYFVMVLFALFSCATEKIEDKSQLVLSLGNKTEEMLWMEDVFDIDEWIELETNPQAMLFSVGKIQVSEDAIYVFDGSQKGKICKFDKQGNFQCNIGNYGKGHGEYQFLNDFTIAPAKGLVYLLDNFSNVLIYSDKGKYIETRKVGDNNMSSIIVAQNNIFTSSNHRSFNTKNDNCLLYSFDDSFRQKKSWGGIKKVHGVPVVSSVFQSANDELYYFDNYDNCVYQYHNDTDVFSKKIDLSLSAPCIVDDITHETINDVDYICNVIFEKKNLIVIYQNLGKSKIAIIDLSNGEIVKEGNWANNISYVSGVDGDIYTIFEPERFLDKDGNMDMHEINRFKKKPQNIPTKESNLYIAKLKLKSFDNK